MPSAVPSNNLELQDDGLPTCTVAELRVRRCNRSPVRETFVFWFFVAGSLTSRAMHVKRFAEVVDFLRTRTTIA